MAEAEKRVPWVTAFGDDPDSWNLHQDDDEQDGEGSGLPGVNVVAEALWTYRCISGDVSIASASVVFNLPLDLVQQAASVVKVAFAPPAMLDPNDLALDDLSGLIATFVALRGDEPSVVETAARLKLHPTRVIEAVGNGGYLYLSGDRDDLANLAIGIDGE